MINFGLRVFVNIVLLCCVASSALASTEGDACRKEVCDSAVEACMRTDPSLLPRIGTEAQKKEYCAAIFKGCMTRTIYANRPWYSAKTVARFMECAP